MSKSRTSKKRTRPASPSASSSEKDPQKTETAEGTSPETAGKSTDDAARKASANEGKTSDAAPKPSDAEPKAPEAARKTPDAARKAPDAARKAPADKPASPGPAAVPASESRERPASKPEPTKPESTKPDSTKAATPRVRKHPAGHATNTVILTGLIVISVALLAAIFVALVVLKAPGF